MIFRVTLVLVVATLEFLGSGCTQTPRAQWRDKCAAPTVHYDNPPQPDPPKGPLASWMERPDFERTTVTSPTPKVY